MTPYIVVLTERTKHPVPAGVLLERRVYSIEGEDMFDAILRAERAATLSIPGPGGETRWRSSAWRFGDAPPAVRDEAVALASDHL